MLRKIRELFSRKSGRAENATIAPAAATPPASRSALAQGDPQVVSRPIPIDDLDPDAVKIIRRLTRYEYTAYLVGGCVRDLLLGRHPKDYDIGTSATPRQVKRLFRNCRIIGRRFRLAHIYFQNRKVIEVATFRALDSDLVDEPSTEDDDLLIRDDNVFGTAAEDALRRDFTINALFYDLNEETVIDYADGLADLKRRMVRAIGDPATRFREDPIRILRAIKFAARLDLDIEPATYEALRQTIGELPKAAPPRILEEINRFCAGGASRRSFELLRETGVFDVILPEFADAYRGNEGSWQMLYGLLDEIDKRQAAGKPTQTGTILTALLLPMIADNFGWQPDGQVTPPRGLKVRELADQYLRPMALRLRVARRDQESCRQTMMTLYRMAPAERVRRQNRRSILRRACLPEALWILKACADLRGGGELLRSFEQWARWYEERPPGEPTDAEEIPGRQRRRRRGGRGGRGGREGREGRSGGGSSRRTESETDADGGRQRKEESSRERGKKPAREKQAREKPVRKSGRRRGGPTKDEAADLPPVWDERYFFAALPTVPESDGEAVSPEAAANAPRPEVVEESAPEERETSPDRQDETEDEENKRPRRRRRGGRGRRGRGRGDANRSAAEKGSSESAGDD